MGRGQSALLGAIDDVYAERDLERFPWHVLALLRRVVPCDIAGWTDLDPEADRVVGLLDPPDSGFPGMEDVFRRLGHQNPLYARYLETGDVGPYVFSDFLTWAELRALPLWQELYRPMGVREQLAFVLDAPRPQVLAITLNRTRRDFSREERERLSALRPHLTRAYDVARELAGLRRDRERLEQAILAAERAAQPPAPPRDERLSVREREVLALVGEGLTAKGVAVRLGVSPRTVHKHLQHAYRKLDAPNRIAALQALRI